MSVPECWLDATLDSPPSPRSQQQPSKRSEDSGNSIERAKKANNITYVLSSNNTTPRASPTQNHAAAHHHYLSQQHIHKPETASGNLNQHITSVRAGRPSTLRPISHYYFESLKEADGLEGNTYEELRVNPFAGHTSYHFQRNDHGLVYQGERGPAVWQAPQVSMPAIGEIRMDVFGRTMPYHVGPKRWNGTQDLLVAPIRQRMTPWYTHPELVAEAHFQARVTPERANDDSSIAERQRQADILRHTKPTGTEEDYLMRQLVFTNNKWTMAQVFEDLHQNQERAWRQYYADVMRTLRPSERPRISLCRPTYDPSSFDAQFDLVDHMRSVADLEQPTTIDYGSFPSYHFRAGVEAVELSKKILLRDEPPKETARNAAARVKRGDATPTQTRSIVRATAANFQPRQQAGVPRVGASASDGRSRAEGLSQRHDSAVQLNGRGAAYNHHLKPETQNSSASRLFRAAPSGYHHLHDGHGPRYAAAGRFGGEYRSFSSGHASSPQDGTPRSHPISMRA